jgi:hypothetical protein
LTKENYGKIARALASRKDKSAAVWREVRQRVAELNDAELAEAEELERIGRRRFEMLKMISGERRRRAGLGKGNRQTALEVEAFL